MLVGFFIFYRRYGLFVATNGLDYGRFRGGALTFSLNA